MRTLTVLNRKATDPIAKTPIREADDSPFAAITRRLGLDPTLVADRDVLIRQGESLTLATGAEESLIKPLICEFQSLDEVKQLIGFSSDVFQGGNLTRPTLRDEDWSKIDADNLTNDDLSILENAAYCYIYGDSESVPAGLKDLVEHCMRPLQIAVYAAGELVIEAGARLTLSGMPALLLFEQLTIHGGGNFTSLVPMGLTTDRLHTATRDAITNEAFRSAETPIL